MQRRISVRGVIVDDSGKLFCVKLTAHANKSEALDYWCIPGGGLDEGEALLSCLHREMIEETGIAPDVGALLYIQQYFDSGKEHLEFFFHVKNADDYKNIDFSATSHGEEEIAEADFVDVNSSYILPEFFTKENIVEHIRTNQPTKFFDYL